jgi:hypothetical protein
MNLRGRRLSRHARPPPDVVGGCGPVLLPVRRVHCLYWVADLKPGDRPQLDFGHAITRMGTPVPVEPLPLTVR